MTDDRDSLRRLLKIVAPGTPLREGMESILRARTGALIVIGDGPPVMKLVSGGFRIDSEMTPANLYELAKMDGALILTPDCRRILYANTMLIPDAAVLSTETGIRHRTAERTARQTGELVICISQRRNVISLYKGSQRYVLRDTSVILTKANQAIQTLERYKTVLDRSLMSLSALELDDLVTVQDVVTVVQRTEMVLRIASEIDQYIAELGTEGRLVSMQMDELVAGVTDEWRLILRDYLQTGDDRTVESVSEQIHGWSSEELIDAVALMRLLGLGTTPAALDNTVTPRGYRLIRRIPRLPFPVIENMVEHFGSLQQAIHATTDELDEVEGIGEVRARAIQDGFRRLREQIMLERTI